jgi:hypothetical protein
MFMAIFQEFITLKKAAEFTGYHPDYIGALIRSNKVTGRKEGRNWFVSRQDLEKHLMTKHYVPIEKIIVTSKKGMYFWGFLITIACVGIILYLVKPDDHTDPRSPKITAVKEQLTDTIEPKDNGTQFGE